MFRKNALFASALFLAAGCASAPPEPVFLSQEQFDTLMKAPPATLPGTDYFGQERAITALLARDDLTTEQRLTALMQRANLRGTIAENRPGAVEDYNAVLALAPEGHRFIAIATERKTYTETQVGHLVRRLNAPGPGSQRIQDMLAMGQHDEAAKFFRDGLGSALYTVETLHKLGYLCEGGGYSGPTYNWGSENTRRVVVRWCDTKAG
jgi:hypothetical protein